MAVEFEAAGLRGLPLLKADVGANLQHRRPLSRRHPAIVVAVCFALGILLDNGFGCPWTWWLLAGAVSVSGWAVLSWIDRPQMAAGFLLCGFVFLGGGRHHFFWSVSQSDDISGYASQQAQPVRVIGRIGDSPVVLPKRESAIRAAWPQLDRSVCTLICTRVMTDGRMRTVSGSVRLQVSGHLLHVHTGDVVEVRGWLYAPGGPQNPGQYDYSRSLRRRGVRSTVFAGHPDAVRRLHSGDRFSWRRTIGRLRAEGEFTLIQHLDSDTVGVATAILLGNRSQLDDEIRTMFTESGMVHLLAISGLHIGIFALFFSGICRFLNLTQSVTAAVIVMAVIGYALITDLRPSAVRATVVIVVWVVGRVAYRTPGVANILAITALILLAWNPRNLFSTGAHLSFLAVIAMAVFGVWWNARQKSSASTIPPTEIGRFAILHKVWQRLFHIYLMMLTIWIFIAPLIAARCHIIAPIGMALNIVLFPLVGLVLASGYLLLLAGYLLPVAAFLPGEVFNRSLREVLRLMQTGASISSGHLYVSGPSEWWLVGYYSLLTAAVIAVRYRRTGCWIWCAICGWTILGLAVGLNQPSQPGLRCTFLSTGHGVAVLLELPNGRTLLYDAGSIAAANRATQTVQTALWHRRRTRLDAIVVSHADIDHFNGVPQLLQTLPVGKLLLTKSFLDFEQQPVVELCETARREGVPIGLLCTGDEIRLDRNVTIRVLQPSFPSLGNDNANSIVLEIVSAGRRILLTGDLEKEGLTRLLQRSPRKIDVMLSPHHGSLKANPPELAAWATPACVVVSGSRRTKLQRLRKIYGSRSRVLSTSQGGAVTVTISPQGAIEIIRGNTP